MKLKLNVLSFLLLTVFATGASAVIIDQDGISYSCTPMSAPSSHCKTSCVKYCAHYDAYPFQNRCTQYATKCGANASVETTCSRYDAYPFEDRCLEQEDVVTIDPSCS